MVRVPTEEQVLENPRRADFVGGGWVDSTEPWMINIYWRRHPEFFTVYSVLQVLEHETLHSVLAKVESLKASMMFENVHRSICAWLDGDKLVFVNEFRMDQWQVPPYHEEPTEDLLE